MILKGFIIGIGKILPGVSGAMLALSFGIYEKCIFILSNLRKELIKNISFIIKLCIGFLLAIILGSRIIKYFISNYYIYTMYLFIGLIMGTIPSIIKETKINKKSIIYIILGFTILFSINFIKLNTNLNSYFLLGIIEAISIIIPGISGTAIMILLGNYESMLNLFINPFTYKFIIFIFGLLLGVILISKFVNYVINKYKNMSYSLITGFLISSIISLYLSIFNKKISVFDALISIILFIIGLFLSKLINKINP